MSFTQQLTTQIAHTSFANCFATVVGCGYMGREYIKAFQALGVPAIRVCSQSEKSVNGVSFFSGGYANFHAEPEEKELVVIAIPTQELIPAAKHFIDLGFRNFLIEKPISLYVDEM